MAELQNIDSKLLTPVAQGQTLAPKIPCVCAAESTRKDLIDLKTPTRPCDGHLSIPSAMPWKPFTAAPPSRRGLTQEASPQLERIQRHPFSVRTAFNQLQNGQTPQSQPPRTEPKPTQPSATSPLPDCSGSVSLKWKNIRFGTETCFIRAVPWRRAFQLLSLGLSRTRFQMRKPFSTPTKLENKSAAERDSIGPRPEPPVSPAGSK